MDKPLWGLRVQAPFGARVLSFVLRSERWVRPTERAGSEGSFICRCLGQRKPSNRASLRGPPIGGQDSDGASYRCSAPYTLSRFAGLPLKGKREIGGTGYCVTYDTDSQSRNAPCVPFRGRGPRSGEGVDEGKNDYDTRCGRDRRRRHYKTHRPAGDTTTLGPKARQT